MRNALFIGQSIEMDLYARQVKLRAQDFVFSPREISPVLAAGLPTSRMNDSNRFAKYIRQQEQMITYNRKDFYFIYYFLARERKCHFANLMIINASKKYLCPCCVEKFEGFFFDEELITSVNSRMPPHIILKRQKYKLWHNVASEMNHVS